MLIEGLNQLLTGASQVTAIVGTTVTRKPKDSGVWAGQMKEGASFPSIVISESPGGETLMTMDGPDVLRFRRFQFSCYAKSYLQVKQLAAAVRTVLDGFTGALSDGTIVHNMKTEMEFDTFEEDPFIYHTPLEVSIACIENTED